MKIEMLHIGMNVKHPNYGTGVVQTLDQHTADIKFAEGLRTVSPETSELEPAEPRAAVSGLDMPLDHFVRETAQAIIKEMGIEKPASVIESLGSRWHRGRMMLHPADTSQLPKEIPLETFFHKIVMMRNNLRVLEQKINSHEKLTDAEKVEMQQYITRCYGSMTTFNILFKNKDDQFNTSAE
ncbi:MAG: hypothetical protein M1608_18155 [Candidatus Omnitrophica bacterium]|nr:hypothetical protein [Candidatus Omnitrophota bacterium]